MSDEGLKFLFEQLHIRWKVVIFESCKTHFAPPFQNTWIYCFQNFPTGKERILSLTE